MKSLSQQVQEAFELNSYESALFKAINSLSHAATVPEDNKSMRKEDLSFALDLIQMLLKRGVK